MLFSVSIYSLIPACRWLDTTPISRVLTRCSQDISAIDEKLSSSLMNTAMFIGSIFLQALAAVVMAGWQMLPPAIATGISGWALGHIFMSAQLPLKRLMSNAKSPIIGHIQNALVAVGL